MWVEIIVCNISVVFLRHSVLSLHTENSTNNTYLMVFKPGKASHRKKTFTQLLLVLKVIVHYSVISKMKFVFVSTVIISILRIHLLHLQYILALGIEDHETLAG